MTAARLPTVGSDNDAWGTVLNDYLTRRGTKVVSLMQFDADPSGAADSTAAVTAAKAALGAGSRGTILVPPGTYLCDPFTLDGFHWLGAGPKASVFKARAGSADYVTNVNYKTGTPNQNEEATIVAGLGFDGTNLTGTSSTNASGGVPFCMAIGNASHFGWTEPTFVIRDCWFFGNGSGGGLHTRYARGGRADCHFERLIAWNNGSSGSSSHGFVLGSDQHWSNCVSLNNYGAGFYGDGLTSGGMTGCKAYSALGTNGYGWMLLSGGNGYVISGCQAQDNSVAGVYLSAAQNYTVKGMMCDSNGPQDAGTAVILASACHNNYLDYIAVDRTYGGGSYVTCQRYALKIDTGSTRNVIVCPDLSQNDYTYGPGNGSTFTSTVSWLASGSGNGAGNELRFGASGGQQAPAFTSPLTPDVPLGGTVVVGMLTGPITINAPAEAWAGAKVSFYFTQDGTGGRNVTWDAAYKFQAAWANTGNTLGKRSSASFVYDGANWVSTSPAANVWF